jgi:hypothetical protein
LAWLINGLWLGRKQNALETGAEITQKG